MRRHVFLFAVLLGLTFSGTALANTYYVSTSGSDTNPGTIASPWRTVSKVNRTTLSPGDVVLFQGGASFSDQTLMPESSGTNAAPLTFGSYGTGRAQLADADGAVWLPSGDHDLVFANLDLTASNAMVFSSAASGSGVSSITLRDSVVHDSPNAGVAVEPQDSDWTVKGNTFRHIGDSGLLVLGARVTIDSNVIVDTGWNTAMTYGKHGIYAKGPDMTISNNDISADTNGSAISLRYHGARVFGNLIHDTPFAISFFPQDPANAGTNRIYSNRMWGITGFAFYYAGTTDAGQAAGIDVVWASNTTQLANASEAVNVSEIKAAHVWLANSVFAGSYGSAYRGCSTCAEFNNNWYGGSSNVPTGTGDKHVAPALTAAPSLSPAASSPGVDTGTTSVAGLSYSAVCDGLVLHYCGSSPDQGAVEYAAQSAPPPTPPSALGVPSGLTLSSLGQNSIGAAWNGATGASGYDVVVNGSRSTSTSAQTYTLSGLSCGTTYTIGVDAFDATGNRSAVTSASATTASCPAPAPPPAPPTPADVTAPTVAFSNVTNGATVPRTFTFQAAAGDAGGIARLEIALDKTAACAVSWTSLACTLSQKGWHTVTATGTDRAGNKSSVRVQVRFNR